jgi:hypothetical protein
MAEDWYDPFSTQQSATVPSLGNFTRQPAGRFFTGTRPASATGVYVSPMAQAYRAPEYDGVVRDSRPYVPATPTTPAGAGDAGMDIETRRALNVGGRPQMGLTAEQEAANILRTLDGGLNFGTSGGGGGGMSRQQQAAMRAIQTLQGRLTAPSETDALQARLADIYKQAEDRIRAAGTELGGALSTPTVARTVTPATPVGSVAMSDYLNAIGASGADVSAQQALSNAIIGNIAGNAQQYATGLNEANETVRRALAAAVPANQLAGISQASLNRAAFESRLAAQRAQERQAVQDQILELALKYGVNI